MELLPKDKKMIALGMAILLIAAGLIATPGIFSYAPKQVQLSDVLGMTSSRRMDDNKAVVVSSSDPHLSIAAVPASCWYDISGRTDNSSGLLPMLIADGATDVSQQRVLEYLKCGRALVLGDVESLPASPNRILGGATDISLKLARHVFEKAAGVLVVPATAQGYELGIAAAPIASYLNIPIVLVPGNPDWQMVKSGLAGLEPRYAIVVASDWKAASSGLGVPAIPLGSQKEVREACAQVINDRFGALNYLTVANPADTIPPKVKNIVESGFTDTVRNLKMVVVGKEMDVRGDADRTYELTIPGGIVHTEIFVNITAVQSALKPVKDIAGVNPMISMEVRDDAGNLLAYSTSMADQPMRASTDLLSVNAPGKATLGLSIYYGTKGLAFLPLPGATGFSRIDATFGVVVRTSVLQQPHLPQVPKLSMLAPYLAAAHGGLVYSDPALELTSEAYASYAGGSMTSPAYNSDLQPSANAEVESGAMRLESAIQQLGKVRSRSGNGTLLDSYLSGPAWIALMGDANMVPMYFYEPGAEKSYPWGGLGWPGDNIYTMNLSLSAGRPMGKDVGEASALVARTLFYEAYAREYSSRISTSVPNGGVWGDNYMFLFGEGGGQTGFIFWQQSFSGEVEQHGFNSEVYGYNFDNDRQKMERVGAYTRANYMEFMLHGNWYWYVPELNGVDQYSTSVKNTDISGWELGPSVYLTAACLMGRIDGIPADQAIALRFIEAGLNAFVGSTRSTGSESGTRWMEWDLLYNDTSMGEAMRTGKQDNPAEPTLYVRTLFADPAFNPYEPENGYSDQGRPVLRQR